MVTSEELVPDGARTPSSGLNDRVCHDRGTLEAERLKAEA
jgi:hypothetical protein